MFTTNVGTLDRSIRVLLGLGLIAFAIFGAADITWKWVGWTGVIPIAIVRFRAVGTPGASTTARVYLGPVLSTPALGSFNYRSLITITNGILTLP